jgi:hypothetical protein
MTPIRTDGHQERSAMKHPNPGLGGTSGYDIRTRGRISDRWSDWFEGMTLIHEDDGTTVIHAPTLDQAALHGLLAKVRDLGLALISVSPTPPPNDSPARSIE